MSIKTYDGPWLAPGSDEALDAGCSCPVIDNGHGMGMYGGLIRDGKPMFVTVQNCQLHGWEWQSKLATENDEMAAANG